MATPKDEVLFRAVVSAPGKTTHSVALRPERQIELKPAASVVVVRSHGAIYLFRYDENGTFAGDTWHESIDDAKDQARFEFDLDESAWIPNDG
jgi:hypothetical protein